MYTAEFPMSYDKCQSIMRDHHPYMCVHIIYMYKAASAHPVHYCWAPPMQHQHSTAPHRTLPYPINLSVSPKYVHHQRVHTQWVPLLPNAKKTTTTISLQYNTYYRVLNGYWGGYISY